jgi:hypothetical protein
LPREKFAGLSRRKPESDDTVRDEWAAALA